jgi:hypothetical protein
MTLREGEQLNLNNDCSHMSIFIFQIALINNGGQKKIDKSDLKAFIRYSLIDCIFRMKWLMVIRVFGFLLKTTSLDV